MARASPAGRGNAKEWALSPACRGPPEPGTLVGISRLKFGQGIFSKMDASSSIKEPGVIYKIGLKLAEMTWWA